MFETMARPRIFGISPGVDFPHAVADGLIARSNDLSRTVIYVNTARMQRQMQQAFQTGPARLLPSIRLLTDLSHEGARASIPPPISTLQRRLELFPLVKKLIESDATTANRAATAEWSDSLANLLEEMHGEGVSLDDILAIDVAEHSGHWQKSLAFLQIIAPFLDADSDRPDPQARLRAIVMHLAQEWESSPPEHPIIIAGSTGSRGVAHLFMNAVARLPQGAVILPGFDFQAPDATWAALDDQLFSEDHPQYRFRKFLDTAGLRPTDVIDWGGTAPNPKRNALISLSLRPAPVTSQWRNEGPALGSLPEATADITLVETDTPRQEAEAIALRLREAAAKNCKAALVTPDRNLTRQVAAALDRWDLIPDDSAGVPLAQTASGRLLRHVADAMGQVMTSEHLLVLLKHPLTQSGADRGPHLLRTRRLEMRLRRNGPPFPVGQDIEDWALTQAGSDPGCVSWASWIGKLMSALSKLVAAPLADLLDAHIALAERLCAGPDKEGAGKLWDEREGREAHKAMASLLRTKDALGQIEITDYVPIFQSVLAQGSVRDPEAGDPRISIWGTLEARVGGADLVILGGLNEGVWPEIAAPDPWLNRQMRQQAGLLLPERRIGLSAHDYQLAMAAPEVWVTRSKRSADAETVPSRWINRLTNLMEGLPDQSGPEALKAMRARGAHWIAWADNVNAPKDSVKSAARPSPQPPLAARPKSLSVTQIKTLIRDPYAIYASKILRLRPLDPLQAHADAPLRGVIFHKILERFISLGIDPSDPSALAQLLNIARDVLQTDCPWPTVQLQWLSRFEQLAPGFLNAEAERQADVATVFTEAMGKVVIPQLDLELIARADRIDVATDDTARIYDYKTATTLPSEKQQKKFDKQLLLTAAMVTQGAFEKIGPRPVTAAAFLGINPSLNTTDAPLADSPPDITWANFLLLMERWRQQSRGYTARLAPFTTQESSPFDTLSRYGEWDMSDAPVPEVLT